jgi:hypothetical protein
VVYLRGDKAKVEVTLADGHTMTAPGNRLDLATSQSIFERHGRVEMLHVTVER